MVKIKAVKALDFEEIKTRIRELQELVRSLKSDDQIRAQKLKLIHQERLFLEQELAQYKTELEQARTQSKPVVLETRVLN
jgi:hypothetical protein